MLLLRVSAADSTLSLAVHLAGRSFAQHHHIDLIISSISRFSFLLSKQIGMRSKLGLRAVNQRIVNLSSSVRLDILIGR
jgi:hypothetical protein